MIIYVTTTTMITMMMLMTYDTCIVRYMGKSEDNLDLVASKSDNFRNFKQNFDSVEKSSCNFEFKILKSLLYDRIASRSKNVR